MLVLGLPGTAHAPTGRVTALARFALVAKAQAMARLPKERRAATPLAFVRMQEVSAEDDLLDLFDIVVTTLFTDAAKVGKYTGAQPGLFSGARQGFWPLSLTLATWPPTFATVS